MNGDVDSVGCRMEGEWCGEGTGGQESGYENGVHDYDQMGASMWVVFLSSSFSGGSKVRGFSYANAVNKEIDFVVTGFERSEILTN